MNIEIRTERLVLRPLGIKYIDTVHEYASDIENTKYMYRLPNRSMEDTRTFLESVEAEWKKDAPSFYEFAIILPGGKNTQNAKDRLPQDGIDNELDASKDVQIGAVSIYIEEDGDESELGWILNKKFWGHGYAYEAASALKKYAVEVLGLRKFCAHCDTRNTQSARVMEKLGMLREMEGDRDYPDERGMAREYKYSLVES